MIKAYFSNSVSVFVFAASTRAQLPCGHVTFVLGLLLLPRQYAAAEYWLKNSSWSRTLADTAIAKIRYEAGVFAKDIPLFSISTGTAATRPTAPRSTAPSLRIDDMVLSL